MMDLMSMSLLKANELIQDKVQRQENASSVTKQTSQPESDTPSEGVDVKGPGIDPNVLKQLLVAALAKKQQQAQTSNWLAGALLAIIFSLVGWGISTYWSSGDEPDIINPPNTEAVEPPSESALQWLEDRNEHLP